MPNSPVLARKSTGEFVVVFIEIQCHALTILGKVDIIVMIKK